MGVWVSGRGSFRQALTSSWFSSSGFYNVVLVSLGGSGVPLPKGLTPEGTDV